MSTQSSPSFSSNARAGMARALSLPSAPARASMSSSLPVISFHNALNFASALSRKASRSASSASPTLEKTRPQEHTLTRKSACSSWNVLTFNFPTVAAASAPPAPKVNSKSWLNACLLCSEKGSSCTRKGEKPGPAPLSRAGPSGTWAAMTSRASPASRDRGRSWPLATPCRANQADSRDWLRMRARAIISLPPTASTSFLQMSVAT
mmetsp:Transcript_30456/g.101233  ORF Transcript_30456/g.101233 Transcript_30456/m.101233 type:complete len:207 (-) Transcript_30456:2142-2762(-)